jgi:two-component system chemotaxis response regulator CheY
MSHHTRYYNFRYIKVMLLDDNRFMLQLFRRILGALGIKDIEEVTDANEAFEALKHYKPDIVFCDWHMADIDGIDFVRRVRTVEDSPDKFIPIIMVTGFSDPDLIKKARDVGVTEFLVKPISVRSVYLRIAEVIERPRPFIRSQEYFGPDRRRGKRPSYQGVNRRGDMLDTGGGRPGTDSDSEDRT